jgi:hypothetical protein
VIWVLSGGFVVGLLLHRGLSVHVAPIAAVLWGWSFAWVWLRKILGFPRVRSFLFLVGVLLACAGLSLTIRMLSLGSRSNQIVLAGGLAMVLAIVVGFSLIRQRLLFLNNETGALVDSAQIVGFLRSELRPGDALLLNSPADPIIEYELRRQDQKLFALLASEQAANRAIAVVPQSEAGSELHPTQEHLARLAAESTSDPSSAYTKIDRNSYDPPRLVANFLSTSIFCFERKQRNN